MTVEPAYLVIDLYHFQGCDLLGIYTTREAAEQRAQEEDTNDVRVVEVSLNAPMNEWMGG
jgi:hypothetical protein